MYVSLGAIPSKEQIAQIDFESVATFILNEATLGLWTMFSDLLGPIADLAKQILVSMLENEIKEAIDAEGSVTTLDFGLYFSKMIYQAAIDQEALTKNVEERDALEKGVITALFGKLTEKDPGSIAKAITKILNETINKVTNIRATVPEDLDLDLDTEPPGRPGPDYWWDKATSTWRKKAGATRAGDEAVSAEEYYGGVRVPPSPGQEAISTPVLVGGAAILAYLLLA